jgi:hypothetical protein
MSITLVVEQAKSASTKPPTTITCATTRVTTGPFQSTTIPRRDPHRVRSRTPRRIDRAIARRRRRAKDEGDTLWNTLGLSVWDNTLSSRGSTRSFERLLLSDVPKSIGRPFHGVRSLPCSSSPLVEVARHICEFKSCREGVLQRLWDSAHVSPNQWTQYQFNDKQSGRSRICTAGIQIFRAARGVMV